MITPGYTVNGLAPRPCVRRASLDAAVSRSWGLPEDNYLGRWPKLTPGRLAEHGVEWA